MSTLHYFDENSNIYYDKLVVGEPVYHNERERCGVIRKVAANGYYVEWNDKKGFLDGPYTRWQLQSIDDIVLNTDKVSKGEFSRFITKVAEITYSDDFKILKEKLSSRVKAAIEALKKMINENLINENDSSTILRLLRDVDEKVLYLKSPALLSAYLDESSTIIKKLGFIQGADILNEIKEECDNYNQFMTRVAQESSITSLQQALNLLTDVVTTLRDRDIIVKLTRAAEILNKHNIDSEDIWRSIDRLLSAINYTATSLSEDTDFVRKILQRQQLEREVKEPVLLEKSVEERVQQPIKKPIEQQKSVEPKPIQPITVEEK